MRLSVKLRLKLSECNFILAAAKLMAGARGSTIAVLALPVKGTSDPFLISPLDYHRRCIDLLSHTLDQVVRFCGGYNGEVTTGGKDCYSIINYVSKECSLFSRVFKVDYAELSDWCDLFLKYVRGPAEDDCANESYTEDNCLELFRNATLFLEHILQAMGPTNLRKVISSTLASVNKMAESVQDLKVYMERKKYNEETHVRNPTQYIQNIVDILDKNQQDKQVKQLLLEIVGPRLNFSVDSSCVQQSKAAKTPDIKLKTEQSSITSPASILSSEISEESSQQDSPVSSPLFQSRSQSISPEVKPIELQRPPTGKTKTTKTKVEPDGVPKQTQGLTVAKLKPSVRSSQVEPSPAEVKHKQISVTKGKPLVKPTKPITPAKPITPTKPFIPTKPITPTRPVTSAIPVTTVKPATQLKPGSKQVPGTLEESPLPTAKPEVQASESNILSKMRSNSVVKSSIQQWNSSTDKAPVKPKSQRKLQSPFYNAETWPRLKSANGKPTDKQPKPHPQPDVKPFLKPKPAGNFRPNTLPSKIAKPENKSKPEPLKPRPHLGSLSSPDLQAIANQSDSETKSKLLSPSRLQSPNSFGFKPGQQPRLAYKYFKMT